ncbi:MAG: cyclic nucleotide-binding domain-containing protein [Gammaproteobacteria bacterium]|nr:cyclic nucleotide-binding domain-containing protein [Gammaproteobacteria bacterium]
MVVRDIDQFETALRQLVPLNTLSPAQFDRIMQQSALLEFRSGQHIFRQGDRDDHSFYLLEGEIELLADGERVQHIRGGTERAARALAQLQPRQMSAKARGKCTVLRVDSRLLDGLARAPEALDDALAVEVHELDGGDDIDWMTRMLQSALFAQVPAANIQRIFSCMEAVEVKAGDAVIQQGATGDYYYIIRQGRCAVTRKTSAGGPPIVLAELHPGDGFGEEALIADARRNATVTMLSDGELMRLHKEHFVELIRDPLLTSVRFADARAAVAAGAIWLDVRFNDEHARAALPGSLNLPLNVLRLQCERLPRDRRYVVYCDNGQRSSVGAFLLVERGLDAVYVDGGVGRELDGVATDLEIITEVQAGKVIAFPPPSLASGPVPVSQRSEIERESFTPPPVRVDEGQATLEADVRAEALRAELARANMQLEEARHLEAQAQAERRRAEREQAAKLRAERRKLAGQARKAQAMLREAQRMKVDIESAKRAADEQVQQRRQAEEERIQRLHDESERRLQEEKARLEQVYRWKSEELARFQKMKDEAEVKLADERERIASQAEETRRRLAEARRIEREVEQTRLAAEAEAEQRQQRQLELEQRLNSEIRTRIDSERRKLEAEFARNAEQLELARREKIAAEAARRAAAEEAERIIAEYRESHARVRAAEEAKIAAERERIEREAAEIGAQLEAARLAKAEAEAARLEAMRVLEEQARAAPAVAERDTVAADELRASIQAIEAEVSHADAELRAAHAAQAANEMAMEEHLAAAEEMLRHVEVEIADWQREQHEFESSAAQQEILAGQRAYMERIKLRAQDARRRAKEHDQSLLDEIAARLRHPDED